ncbi:MAG: LicD family protein [Clostridiaceae bacterium]|nr:LicD family protein [Clostridiaceae bacterium]
MYKEYDEKTLKKVQETELEILRDFVELCDKHNIEYFGIAGTGIGALRHQGFIPWDDDIDVALTRKNFDKFIEKAKIELSDKYTIMNAEEFENYPLMTTRLMKKGTHFREYALKDVKCDLGIFLDIYAFDNISDDEKEFKKQARAAWFWSKLMILRSVPFPVLAFKGVKAKIIHTITAIVHYLMVACRISKKFLYKKCYNSITRYNDRETKRVAYLCDTSPYTNTINNKDLYPLKKLPYEDMQLSFPNDMHEMLVSQYGDYMQLPPEEKRKNHYPYELDFGDGECNNEEDVKEATDR